MNAWFGRVGSAGALPENKPSVWMITNQSFPVKDAEAVASGCEEEGVPLVWDIKSGMSAELARMACMRSHLKVGIGIDEARSGSIALVSVTDAPYIERGADSHARLRWLGQTAARISKGEPVEKETME
jgi:hypothetical protein